MGVIRYVDCFQGHPVPKTAHRPKGPFPQELFIEPEIVNEYEKPYSDDGSNFLPGATAQNNFQGWRWLRCYDCHARVREDETEDHECDE